MATLASSTNDTLSLTGGTFAVSGAGTTFTANGPTTLATVNLTASGGGQMSFPSATSYTSGTTNDYSIQASGVGSVIDLSHLTSLTGSTSVWNVAITAATGGMVNLAGAITGNTSLAVSGSTSTMTFSTGASFTNTHFNVIGGATFTNPVGVRLTWGSTNTLAVSGTGSVFSNQGVLVATGNTTVTIDAAASFTNNGVLESANGGIVTINGNWTNTGVLTTTGGILAVRSSITNLNSGAIVGIPTGLITLGGSLLGNTTSAALFAPLAPLRIDGTGNVANPQLLEVMSHDLLAAPVGFTNNFLYQSIELGNNTRVRLVDQSDNAPGSDPEALYVNSIVIPAGTTLDLNHLRLYARAVQSDGAVVNGTIIQIADSGPIVLATPTSGQIDPVHPGQLDEWTLFGHAGRSITARINPGSSGAPAPLSPYLSWANVQILDPQNNPLGPANGVNSASPGAIVTLNNILLPTDGTYKIRVRASTDHTASTGNYLVGIWDSTPNVQTLPLSQNVSGTIATPFSLDQWNFSATAGQQVQFHVNGSSGGGLGFSLTGPGGYTAFTDLGGDSPLTNLPSSGAYTLNAYTLNGASGSYNVVLRQTSVTVLPLENTYNGSLAGSGQAQLFIVPVTTTDPLSFILTDPNPADHTELYVRFGSAPTRQTYDYGVTGAGASHSLLVSSANAGMWYVLVFSESVPSAPSPFTLRAISYPVVLTASSSSRGSASTATTLTLTGAGFNAGSQVRLVSSGGGSYPANSATTDLPTQITATFNAGSVPAGTYSITVTQPGGASAQLPGAFTMVQGGQAVLSAHIEVPDQIGYHIATTLYVDYSNIGDAAMPAPLLIFSATQNGRAGAFLTMDAALQTQGFWTSAIPAGYAHSVQILASGATPGVLEPGESIRVPVYYGGWQAPHDLSYSVINFSLGSVRADDPTPVDWASMESSLQPTGIPIAPWHIMYSNLAAQMGGTSGGYVQLLNSQASYLGRLGEHVTDVSRLWSFAVAQAGNVWPAPALGSTVDDSLPVPGTLPLSFSRTFNQSILDRFQSGPLGLGWSTPWQEALTVASDGTVTVTNGTGRDRSINPIAASRAGISRSQGILQPSHRSAAATT